MRARKGEKDRRSRTRRMSQYILSKGMGAGKDGKERATPS